MIAQEEKKPNIFEKNMVPSAKEWIYLVANVNIISIQTETERRCDDYKFNRKHSRMHT